jgi:hypothetical protein
MNSLLCCPKLDQGCPRSTVSAEASCRDEVR